MSQDQGRKARHEERQGELGLPWHSSCPRHRRQYQAGLGWWLLHTHHELGPSLVECRLRRCCQNRLSGATVYVKNIGEDHQKCGTLSGQTSVQTVDCKGLTGTNLSINLGKT